MEDDTVIVAVVKGKQRYLFSFRPTKDHCREVVRIANRWARNGELSFNKQDASTVLYHAVNFYNTSEK